MDVRPKDYYEGKKSDEPRAGHIPGALNRPFSEDLHTVADIVRIINIEELKEIYGKLLPSKSADIIVHCRTGHQASQTVFILRRLLGYKHVYWYDGGWSEWSAKPTLPLEV